MEAVFVIGLLIPLFLFTVHHMPHLHDQPHAHLVFTYLCGFLLFVLHYIPQLLYCSIVFNGCVILLYIYHSGSRVELQFNLVLSLLNVLCILCSKPSE